jgi:hypothetical protein
MDMSTKFSKIRGYNMNKLAWISIFAATAMAGCAAPCCNQYGYARSWPSVAYYDPSSFPAQCGRGGCGYSPVYVPPPYAVPAYAAPTCGSIAGAVGPGCAYGSY